MLEKQYEPKPIEEKWLKAWLESGTFNSDPAPGKKQPFVIVIPPPNITGALHMGHALNDTLQDVLVRYHRMKGEEALWVPGTDHGGIATQNVMEKILKAEKIGRHDLGRDKFLERMQVWSKDIKQTILGQLKRVGCALDWRREAFTMDEARGRAVNEAFARLWKDGLIYRGERMINWCVRCGTALSDIEVAHEDRKGHLWYIRYPAEDGGEGITVATTRPETLLGDTAVAVPIDSAKWKHLIGKNVELPLTGRSIPVIADPAVDAGFGEGAVKVTPAHDPNDFEIGLRHKLPSVKVIDFHGKMTQDVPAEFRGLPREKAREAVVAALEARGLLKKTEPYTHAVPVCDRCQQVIEPLVSNQWFVKMEELATPALKAAEDGRVVFHPESWKKPYVEWLKGIKDWCISRQIWWGHRIPVWYCLECNKVGDRALMDIPDLKATFSVDLPRKCAHCGSTSGKFVPDPDVLDTWFSSALWPFSVFGWPEATPDLKFFYPTTALVTGYEILYLWVARMQMMGLRFLGEVPFSHVYIHGIVRDRHGKKMSKSLGNVIDPLTMMEKYGTDAMRFSLAAQSKAGKDIPFSDDMIVGARNFTNKLWNTTRFVLMNLPEDPKRFQVSGAGEGNLYKGTSSPDTRNPTPPLELADRWILGEYRAMVRDARASLDAYDPASAADTLYGFVWDRFCDWYLELAKIRLMGADEAAKDVPRAILVEILDGVLKLLHPFMPFITEECWQAMKPYTGEKTPFALHAHLPLPAEPHAGEDQRAMEVVMEVTRAIRAIRSQFDVPPSLQLDAVVSADDAPALKVLSEHGAYIRHLARLKDIRSQSDGQKPPHSATAVVAGLKLFIPLEGIIDLDKEKARLKKETDLVREEMGKLDVKLGREDFRTRAPKAEVDRTLARKAELEAKLKEIETHLSDL